MKRHTLHPLALALCGAAVLAALLAFTHPRTDSPDGRKHPMHRYPLSPVSVDTTYTFIRYADNHMYIAPDSTSVNRFFASWQRLVHTNQGHISIMHIGSSHVQGGTLPHTIRRNLLLAYPDLVASRGMIFPYSAARKCNNPYDYTVSRDRCLDLTRCVYKEPQQPLGLCGIAVTAADSTSVIGLRLSDSDLDFATTEVVLLGHSHGGVVPLLRCGTLRQVPSRIDSLRHRYYFNLPVVADSFSIILPCEKDQSFALTGVLLRNDYSGFTYHSIGVNGASLADYLRCPHFATDLQLVKPDMVIFGIGINDAAAPGFDTLVFRQQYQRLIDTIRSVSPSCAFVFITNNDSFRRVKKGSYAVNTNGALARQVFYRLADANGGMVWDQFQVMGGLRSMDQWRKAGLAQSDRVHFTRSGYQMIGNLFTNALFEAYQRFDLGRPFNPMLPALQRSSNLPTPRIVKPSSHERTK